MENLTDEQINIMLELLNNEWVKRMNSKDATMNDIIVIEDTIEKLKY